jgi:hypothetical protein
LAWPLDGGLPDLRPFVTTSGTSAIAWVSNDFWSRSTEADVHPRTRRLRPPSSWARSDGSFEDSLLGSTRRAARSLEIPTDVPCSCDGCTAAARDVAGCCGAAGSDSVDDLGPLGLEAPARTRRLGQRPFLFGPAEQDTERTTNNDPPRVVGYVSEDESSVGADRRVHNPHDGVHRKDGAGTSLGHAARRRLGGWAPTIHPDALLRKLIPSETRSTAAGSPASWSV